MGGLTAQAAHWTASMTADMKLPHRGLSLNFQERMLRQKGGLQNSNADPQDDNEVEVEMEDEDKVQVDRTEDEDENEEPQTLPTSVPTIVPQTPPHTPFRAEDPARQIMEWGENLAFIDESSDTQSEKGMGEGEKDEKREKGKVQKGRRRKRTGGKGGRRETLPTPRNRDKGESG